MGFSDRQFDEPGSRGGNARRILGRIFGDVENPLGWSLTLYTLAGIRVRIHLLFVVFIIARLLWSLPRDTWGITFTAISMTSLFVVVLLHEYGHCIACRMVKGEANDILMWPLGGLASCAPPHTWKANLITTIGGPLVNVLILPLTSVGLLLTGNADSILVNPFAPTFPAEGTILIYALWVTHLVNIVILGFNVLFPMFPLDGGRIIQAILWARKGERRSMEISVVLGLGVAGIVGVFALVSSEVMLLGVAIFGGAICWMERQRLRMETAEGGYGVSPYAASAMDQFEDEPERGPSRSEKKQLEREAKEQEELDRILAKISEGGMQSLSKAEQRTLQRATDKSRDG